MRTALSYSFEFTVIFDEVEDTYDYLTSL